jgi:hypothetical protein
LSRGEIGHEHSGAWRDMDQTALPSAHAPPLSRDLRDFPFGLRLRVTPVGGRLA